MGDDMKCSIRSVLFVLGVLGLPVLLDARPAAAAVPDIWAFAFNDTLAPAPGSVMNPAYQWGTYKTSCPGSNATITRTSIGRYVVIFPCTAAARGIVHVTAVDNNARFNGIAAGVSHMQVTALSGASGFYCQLEAIWTVPGGDVLAPVICFNNAGVPVDNLAFTSYATP
jgi:hypothetical protein